MSIIDEMKAKAQSNPKNITVKVECISTGMVINYVDCQTNKSKADTVEDDIKKVTDQSKFFVYQSVTV
jgi:hypothetical protein